MTSDRGTSDRVEQAIAQEQIKAIGGFYNHFMVYVAVIAVLVGINLATGDKFWVHWVILGWGVGLAFHAFLVFIRKPQRLADAKARHTSSGVAKPS